MKFRESLSIDPNIKDTDDMEFFVLGVASGILIGTISTFVGNIMTHGGFRKMELRVNDYE